MLPSSARGHWSYGGIKRASLQGNAYSDRYCGRKATLCAKLGVPYVLNAADDQVIDAIKNITHGTMAQVVIEASGANSAIRNTLDLASFAGRISFTGWPKQETSLPTNLITYKELDLRGSRTSAGEFDEALRMLSTLEINPQDVVSKVVNLDEIPDAVKELDRYPERYLKINAVFH